MQIDTSAVAYTYIWVLFDAYSIAIAIATIQCIEHGRFNGGFRGAREL